MSQNATTAAALVTAKTAMDAALATRLSTQVTAQAAHATLRTAVTAYQAASEADDRPAK